MYKILIGDDEQIVRDGIRKLIDWNSLGLELVGAAEDGKQAYDLIKEHKPDIVMLDICMPQIDGLALCKMLKEENIDCELVIVTGYDEFSYAREALKLGVKDYILKPLTKIEVYEILQKIVASLNSKKEKEDELNNKIQESRQFKLDRILNGLIYGDIILELQDKKFMEEVFNNKWYAISVMDMDDLLNGSESFNEDEIRLTKFALFNIASEVIEESKSGIVFRTEENEIAVLFQSSKEDSNSAMDEFKDILLKIKDCCMRYLKVTVSMGVGTILQNFKDLTESYNKARRAIEYRFFLGGNVLLFGNELDSDSKLSGSEITNFENTLIKSIKELKDDKVQDELENLCRYMKSQKLDRGSCVDIWVKLFILMIQAFENVNINIMKSMEGKLKISEKINELKNIVDIKDWFFSTYRMCREYIKIYSDTNTIYVSNIKEYLNKNYSNEKLSFEDLCKHIHLSPSYLATIFKNEIGKTFIECLTDIRLQKAVELLKNTNLKVYEVGEQVGYPNSHYFSSLFKKVFGESPSEYKNSDSINK